jgi:hypothetical protein
MQTGVPASNPLPLIMLLFAVLAALTDWSYKRKGGKKPSRRNRILFRTILSLVVALFVIVLILSESHPAEAEEISVGGTAAIVRVVILLFGVWEFSRWMVRRKNPLTKPPAMP